MTFKEFQAKGKDVDDIGTTLDDGSDYLVGVNGRLYLDTLWAVPCVTSGVGWMTVIGNQEFESKRLSVIERKLFEFAQSEGVA